MYFKKLKNSIIQPGNVPIFDGGGNLLPMPVLDETLLSTVHVTGSWSQTLFGVFTSGTLDTTFTRKPNVWQSTQPNYDGSTPGEELGFRLLWNQSIGQTGSSPSQLISNPPVKFAVGQANEGYSLNVANISFFRPTDSLLQFSPLFILLVAGIIIKPITILDSPTDLQRRSPIYNIRDQDNASLGDNQLIFGQTYTATKHHSEPELVQDATITVVFA